MDQKIQLEDKKEKKFFLIGNACVSEKVTLVSGPPVFMSALRQVLGSLFDYTGINPLKHVVGVIHGYRALIH